MWGTLKITGIVLIWALSQVEEIQAAKWVCAKIQKKKKKVNFVQFWSRDSLQQWRRRAFTFWLEWEKTILNWPDERKPAPQRTKILKSLFELTSWFFQQQFLLCSSIFHIWIHFWTKYALFSDHTHITGIILSYLTYHLSQALFQSQTTSGHFLSSFHKIQICSVGSSINTIHYWYGDLFWDLWRFNHGMINQNFHLYPYCWRGAELFVALSSLAQHTHTHFSSITLAQ